MSLEKIQSVLAEHPEIQLAYLFGSMAAGSATATSDADIAVQTYSPLTVEAKISLVEEIAIATGRPVDLIDLRKTGEPLLGQILQHGIRLKGDDTLHAELMRRHIFDSEDFLPYVRRMLAERRQSWTS
ncbi:nucleotidyltransferase domain-containing protein [Pseudomonas sp. gcc21]|uniref:type VII toxin-antitoxin system MntA family adenylyltransferase antitoxin n=1 Tax=Pseudomonas sp. gcc21 TaxID=2726989 RepID=UPI001452104A|nr:nucleotidyltransferase domain-containing protein [Pseudomonas sp. gcc21]QJD59058.1 nucleotidyltransferase domain-containing protein [Pseudomonas sp. gcc21]